MPRSKNQNRKCGPKYPQNVITGANWEAHHNALFGMFGDDVLNVLQVLGEVSADVRERAEETSAFTERALEALHRLDAPFFRRIADLLERIASARKGVFADPVAAEMLHCYEELIVDCLAEGFPTFRAFLTIYDRRNPNGLADEIEIRRICTRELGLKFARARKVGGNTSHVSP
jgi:hypothetical protein